MPRLIEENLVSGINYTDNRVNIGRGHLVGDFNGDGVSDIAEKIFSFNAIGNSVKSLHSISIKIKDPNTNSFIQSYVYPLNLDYTTPESAKAFRDENFLVGDINGDGADDILIGIRKAGYDNKYNKLAEFKNQVQQS